ncbi:serine/threonine protein phosphatase [Rhizobium sp. RHZ02]|uniref:metallophosphoesterase family protein n=1 Tax=Rhizobium sp. RHZ02 TaxID=2769306 RepID=UPI00177C4676|nr:metallophosphoesterase family protein [Rhizobium sp. RHZ02]MBD9455931.1 serine/threonine protein phosphatase [Rhizobium sp. RHZ02]
MSYTFAIGDVHGCLEPLLRLVSRIEMSRPEGGTIVFLGDYVDRGPDSRGVIDFIMAGPQKKAWKWIALKGNHEDMMVGALTGREAPDLWLLNGGDATMDSWDGKPIRAQVDWAGSLPLKHQDEHRFYVHAGMLEDVSYDDQTEKILLWSRLPNDYSGEYGGKHLVHGHTPIGEPTTIGNRTNVDSACVFGNKLSCAVFHDETRGPPIEFMSVPARIFQPA